MFPRSSLVSIAAFAGTVFMVGSAFAGKPPIDDLKDKVKEERREAKEAKKSGDPAAIASAKKELTQAEEDLRAEKRKKHAEHLAAARAKWGDSLKKAGVKQEMSLHAKRIARLKRVESLAVAAKKEAVAKRAKAAIDKENERHEKKMRELKAGPPPAGTAPKGGTK